MLVRESGRARPALSYNLRPMKAVVGCIAGMALGVLACSKPPPKAPEKCPVQSITVSFLSSNAVNKTAEGEARPVVVRLYQLKGDERLFNASFEQIWQDDKTTLGEDLVSMQEVQVYPGARTDRKFERPPAVNHVVGVALFSNPAGRAWFASLDLPPIPEAGKCSCPPGDEECESASVAAPHLVYWLDANKIDDGVEHLDDYPTQGPAKKAAAN